MDTILQESFRAAIVSVAKSERSFLFLKFFVHHVESRWGLGNKRSVH